MMGSSGTPATGEASVAAEGPKRLYYGWVVVAAGMLLFVGFIGTLLSFGVFVGPLRAEFGWTQAAVSGAMSLCIGVQGITGVIMGKFTDKYNMGYVVAVGTLVGAASYLFLSRLDSLWEFYLGFGVGAGMCSGCAFTPVTATVSKWFDERRRTMALGITLTGVMIGQMVLSPTLSHVIQISGWSTAYLVAMAVVVACGLPAMLVMFRKPLPLRRRKAGEAGAQGPTGPGRQFDYTVREAARTAPFWMLVFTAFAISCGFYIVASQIVTAGEDAGLAQSSAALILTFMGLGSMAGGLLAWWFTRRLGGQMTLVFVLSAQALAMFLFIAAGSAWSFFVVAVIFGFTYGTAAPVRMALIPPLFGLRCIGAMLGCTTIAWSVGGIVGPALAGYIYDVSGEHALAFVFSGVMYALGALSARFWGAHKAENMPACDEYSV